MRKVTPDSQKTENASSNAQPDLQEPDADPGINEEPVYQSDFHHAPYTPSKYLSVNPEVHVHEMLSVISETAASALVIISDKADLENGTVRNTLLGIHLLVSVMEASANKALDVLYPVNSPATS